MLKHKNTFFDIPDREPYLQQISSRSLPPSRSLPVFVLLAIPTQTKCPPPATAETGL